MWKCPKCNREFDNKPPHHFCDSGAMTIGEYIEDQAEYKELEKTNTLSFRTRPEIH
jgi:hypothetical protein